VAESLDPRPWHRHDRVGANELRTSGPQQVVLPHDLDFFDFPGLHELALRHGSELALTSGIGEHAVASKDDSTVSVPSCTDRATIPIPPGYEDMPRIGEENMPGSSKHHPESEVTRRSAGGPLIQVAGSQPRETVPRFERRLNQRASTNTSASPPPTSSAATPTRRGTTHEGRCLGMPCGASSSCRATSKA
jgi:hypothetical protein